MSHNAKYIRPCHVTRGRVRDIVCNGLLAPRVFRVAEQQRTQMVATETPDSEEQDTEYTRSLSDVESEEEW